MIAIPNMERPESCFQCDNSTCDHWGEYGYDNSADCPLIDIVQCKECKHRDPEDKKCDSGMPERQGCIFPVDDDYFCKYGERRSE